MVIGEAMKRIPMKKRHQFMLFTVPIMFMVCCLLYTPTREEIRFEDLTTTEHVIKSGGDSYFKLPSILGQLKIMTDIHDYLEEARPQIQHKFVNENLEQALQEDKGTGCDIPKTDPFAKEIMQFHENLPLVTCAWYEQSWVRCYMSTCKVESNILSRLTDIECTYRNIITVDDFSHYLGENQVFKGNQEFKFNASDHVEISCTGLLNVNGTVSLMKKWKGYGAGFRPVRPKKPPPGREKTYDVLLFAFDSTSKNGFIRKMPKSYRFLKEKLNAVIFNGYQIVGDGTPAALFPLLTGRTEIELPECRYMGKEGGNTLDGMPFIFYKLTEDGYRTAYFEDMPWVGSFQYRYNGFSRQPADHYLRSFYNELAKRDTKDGIIRWGLCVDDTPRFKLMINLTDQFFQLDGKKFGFTFIADISHERKNYLNSADDALVDFLQGLIKKGVFKDTFLIVMGDHGPRFQNIRETLQGKLEERLPMMAIRLPDSMKVQRPDAQSALELNADVLTTPHDIHSTLLDVLDMKQHWNDYKVKGADLTRGLTLLEPIPKNRSCSEAGIVAHWCVCIKWEEVASSDPLYNRTAQALVDQINSMTKFAKEQCARRTLTAISWVMRKQNNRNLMIYKGSIDFDGFIPNHDNGWTSTDRETYQVKIQVGPGKGMFEAAVTHLVKSDKLVINTREISRTNSLVVFKLKFDLFMYFLQ